MSFLDLRKPTMAAGLILALAACASQPMNYDAYDPPGFFMGFWNGLTVLFSMIGHLFDNGIRIYAFPNSGGWYDFGFLIGIKTWWVAVGWRRSPEGNNSDKKRNERMDDGEGGESEADLEFKAPSPGCGLGLLDQYVNRSHKRGPCN